MTRNAFARVALAQTIEELAERTSGPRFRPHVTLLSGIPSSTPVELVRSRSSAAVKTWSQAQVLGRAPLELTMEDVDTRSPRYFQFVFAHIRPTADLLSLRQACRSVFFSQDATSTPADDYMPHLSLAYGGKGAEAILSDLRSAASGGGSTAPTDGGRWAMDGCSFEADAVELWSCEGPPAEWACLDSIPLSTASDETGRHEAP